MKRRFVVIAGIAVLAAVALFAAHRVQAPVALAAAAVKPAEAGPALADDHSAPTPLAYVEDQYYRRVPHPSPVDDPKVISVEEFFWYGCPHCLRLEPMLAQWLPTLPQDVKFQRVPENLGRPEGVIHQRAFYAAQNLGVEAQVHLALMTALVVQHQPLVTPQVIANFVASQAHIPSSDFSTQYSSFIVDGEVNRASELSFNYGITGVPSLIVGGRYVVDTGLPGIVNGGADEDARFARMLKVASFLVDKVRSERAQQPR